MVSNIGAKLASLSAIQGFGYRRVHHPRMTHGRGVARKAVGSVIGSIGHALVNKIASVVSGGSHKLTGAGKRRVGRQRVRRARKPRATLEALFEQPILEHPTFGGRKHVVHRRRPRLMLI